MILFKRVAELKNQLQAMRRDGVSIGFVPTMGALHEGHLSLLKTSIQHQEITVCSIFVNPTQFNDAADFQKYPVTLETDIYQLEKNGTDILFLPQAEDIYPGGTSGLEHYDIGYLETVLEGKYRPGHFQGVCQVMHRLLDIVQPDDLYMGQKDYQQCLVVKHLVSENFPATTFHTCPTLREPDGLAMSSRNMRLNEVERARATGIYKALLSAKNNLHRGRLDDVKDHSKELLSAHGFRIDYFEIADADTLQLVDVWDGSQRLVALAAAYQHEIRLIDNMLLNDELNLK